MRLHVIDKKKVGNRIISVAGAHHHAAFFNRRIVTDSDVVRRQQHSGWATVYYLVKPSIPTPLDPIDIEHQVVVNPDALRRLAGAGVVLSANVKPAPGMNQDVV